MSRDPIVRVKRALEDAATYENRGEYDDALCAAGHALDLAREAGWPERSMDDPTPEPTPESPTGTPVQDGGPDV